MGPPRPEAAHHPAATYAPGVAPPNRTSTLFDERLTVSWWAWPLALGTAAFLAAELAIGAFYLRHPVTFVVAGLLAALGLLGLSRIRLRVLAAGAGPDGRDAGARFCVDDAWLPVSAITALTMVDTAGRRELLGVEAEALAFVVLRPWIPTGIRIDLDDPQDPTPYWYISTRHPQRLVEALRAAGAPVGVETHAEARAEESGR